MSPLVQENINELTEICKKRQVRRLSLFGSAAEERFDFNASDIDVLVEFHPASPVRYADKFFGLWEDLEQLFVVSVDVVEDKAIRNPLFRQVVEKTKVTLYDAAKYEDNPRTRGSLVPGAEEKSRRRANHPAEAGQ